MRTFIKLHFSPDITRQHPPRRGAEHRQQLARGFLDIVPISRNLAAGTVVDAIHYQPLKGFWMLHLHHAPESKTLRIFQILPEHVVAGAVRMVLHIA